MRVHPETGLVDLSILFAPVSEQEAFVRQGIAGVSGQCLAGVHKARQVVLSVLGRSLQPNEFTLCFGDLCEHPLFRGPRQSLLTRMRRIEEGCRRQWGTDLVVALGNVSRSDEGRVLFFHLREADQWQLEPFVDGDIHIIEELLSKRLDKPVQPLKLELAMSPFGLVDDQPVTGRSWMLPLALACHHRQQGGLVLTSSVFSGALDKAGRVKVNADSAWGKWHACLALGLKSLHLPDSIQGTADDDETVETFDKALTVSERINIFNLEGMNDRKIVTRLRHSPVAARDWKRILPVARSFHDKLCSQGLESSLPATFDYAQRLLASAWLHTGNTQEAIVLLEQIRSRLRDNDGSSLYLDMFDDGHAWLQHAFDYFFTESTALSNLGQLEAAIEAVDERLRALETLTDMLSASLGISNSHRLDYSWTKGLFTKIITLTRIGRRRREKAEGGELECFQEAWWLCHDQRYLEFFEHFIGLPPEELPDYLSVEAVLRSFNYVVDVAFELARMDRLDSHEVSLLEDRRQQVLATWGEQPHDMFFSISCLKIDWITGQLDDQSREHYREIFEEFRDSSFFGVAEQALAEATLS